MSIQISSTSFPPSGPIPRKHSGEGEDISPSLTWSGLPAGTVELAILCDDPDAPSPEPWVHWVLYKIPPTPSGIAENSTGGGMVGINSWGTSGYRGPHPPPGHGVHHYHFRLFALDAPLEAQGALTKAQLLRAIRGHVLAEAEVIGTYERSAGPSR